MSEKPISAEKAQLPKMSVTLRIDSLKVAFNIDKLVMIYGMKNVCNFSGIVCF